MIGKLKGVIDSYGEDAVILDVNGVGYLVHCSARTLQELPRVGEPATLAIETHVREDQIRLFGFLTDVEREWFRLLQTVQGIGTKVALAVLGSIFHWQFGSLNGPVLLQLLEGGIPGVLLGCALARIVPARKLKTAIALIAVFAGLQLLWSGTQGLLARHAASSSNGSVQTNK